jgi:uncharacterized membrane protein YeaQ/YmgE (transglycosylase-associated protein family)
MDQFIVLNFGLLSHCLFAVPGSFVATFIFRLWQKHRSAFERDFARKMNRKKGIRLT